MIPSTPSARLEALVGVLAAVLGTLPVALFASACLARFLPVSADARFALAYVTLVPLWVATMCAVFLARQGWRAMASCLVTATALAAVAYGVPH